ncbi:MAG: tripartite tricarboxylate transporter substrate binding protein [Burkholderiales bacterium]|nr:tripartite tricarboxylate transporter substrate binding protein [Burkholderiales bacterium]
MSASGLRFIIAVSALLMCWPAGAQNYPQRPVRMIAVAAGSGPDVIARMLAAKFAERMGQQFYVENRPGAGGNVGAEFVARAPADGYTLLMGSASQAISMTLFPKLGYDLTRDFIPVSMISTAPFVLVVHPSMPVRSVREWIALAKSARGQLLYSSGGAGTPPHLASQMLKTAAGIDFVHVPYKGIMPAVNDLIGGHVHFSIAVTTAVLPLVQSKRLRGLGVTSAARSALAPEMPTISETIKGFEVIGWYGLFAPTGTPPAVVTRLYQETQHAIAQPDVIERLLAVGSEPQPMTPAAFAAFVQSEIRKWGRAVKESNAQPD